MNLSAFKEKSLFEAVRNFFDELNVPVNEITGEPGKAEDILVKNYKNREPFTHINQVYTLGMIDDAAFKSEESINPDEITEDYDGILVFAVELNPRENNYLPTRSQLSEIARAFNREFIYTPVVVLFKYSDEKDHYLAFANTERLKYKQKWLEGEKVGKVSLLRDIDINNTHAGHERILNDLRIQRTGGKSIDSFQSLYKYWQEVFSVSVLNKKFYKELQSWYFWAIREVAFPNAPNPFDFDSDTEFEDALKEHKGKNVIRLLTRLLFIWFIKEKNLIPEEIFEEEYISENFLKEFTPQKPQGIFATGKQTSMFYRAILQNLFFATLNREMNKREFRKEGAHMNVTTLMRYKDYFKNGGAEKFIELMESTVPFLNGGLFECLDKPHPTKKGKKGGDIIIYEDGFSDRLDNVLHVPDYLFFDVDEEVDISGDIGLNSRAYKNARTRGLLEILKSYKFTITENTPIEEDVALDPELLGKVFENLLASYNPETKTTARKQTGSFYTPREIVNYMVDESLIAYINNFISDWKSRSKEETDKDLHKLLAFDNPENPFSNDPELQSTIIKALDAGKILDPACGSGAFPMGILQKMVYILEKIDPKNNEWKQRQIERVDKAIEQLEDIDDVEFREKSIKELEAQKADIEESFANNELDYGRKLYLIENCIFGVDIQSIAVQISKLRFFISLIVDQKIDKNKANFGVRPLPNLETKFVAANTLIGIEKPKEGDFTGSLFDSEEVKKLEDKLKKVRHKLFSSKSPKRKRELRDEDKQLREQIAGVLKTNGWPSDTAEKLAAWDPYDQNASSPFFNPEWMFDVTKGFDIVLGNPPYLQVPKGIFSAKSFPFSEGKDKGKQNLYKVFVEASKNLSKRGSGTACLIVQSSLLCDLSSTHTRELLLKHTVLKEILEFPKIAPTREGQVFESVLQGTCIYRIINDKPKSTNKFRISVNNDVTTLGSLKFENIVQNTIFVLYPETMYIPLVHKGDFYPINLAKNHTESLSLHIINISQGDLNLTSSKKYFTSNNTGVKLFRGKNVQRYCLIEEVEEFIKNNFKKEQVEFNINNQFLVCQEITGTTDKFRLHFCITPKNEKFLFGHTANKLLCRFQTSLEALAVILNSKFLDWLFRKTSTNNHVMGYEISQFPIPKTFNYNYKVLKFIYFVINFLKTISDSRFQLLEIIANAFVFNLYFPDHMKERKIDVLDFVEEDINNVMQGREFEKLSDSEKEEIIAQLHQKWTDPENEVVKRMAQFKEKSPDILKVIMEG